MNEEEKKFRENLLRSVDAVAAVAAHYCALGYETYTPPLRIRPSFTERAAYGDGGKDLLIWLPGNSHKHRIEVKWRSICFTCADDFPFKTVNIDRVNKQSRLADMYVSVNRALTHGAAVSPETRNFWLIEKGTDPRRGYSPYEIYRCPIEYVIFKTLLPRPPRDTEKS